MKRLQQRINARCMAVWFVTSLLVWLIYGCSHQAQTTTKIKILSTRPLSNTIVTDYPSIYTLHQSDEKVVLVGIWGKDANVGDHKILILASVLAYSLFNASCASIQQSELSEAAIKKTEAAIFYFEHGDYQKSKELCMEALTIWSKMQNSTPSSYAWWIKKNIDDCNLLLKRIKRIQSPSDLKNMSI